MQQLYGVFIILRALFPLLFCLTLYLILRRLAAEVKSATATSFSEINQRAGHVKATLAAGQTTAIAIGEDIEEIATTVSDIAGTLTIDLGELEIPEAINPFTLAERLADLLGAEIEPTLDFVTKTLTDTYEILGLGQVKTVLDNVLDVMVGMATGIGIATIGEDVWAISAEVGNMTGALFKLWLKWRRLIRGFFYVSLALLILIYTVWLLRELIRGVALLAGLPDPGPG